MGMFGEFAFVVSGVLVLCAPAFAAGGAPRVPVNRVTSEGFIRQWLVVGGFPNRRIEGAAEGAVSREGYERDFLEPVGGEASGAFDPAHGVPYEDAEGNSAVAEPFLVSAASDGLLDLAAAFDGATDAVAYAYCRIQSDGPERVSAYFGSDDSAKVYLNGELVHSVWTPGRAAVRWTESFPLELRQGANDLLVKVEQRVGGWGFYLELYRAGDMDAARLSRVENITFETESLVLPAGTGAIRGTITPGPVDGPVIMPAAASLNDADGNVLISQSVVTGRPISLPLPDGYGGYVEAHFTASREGRPDLTSEERFYIGDYEGDKAALLQKARAAVARCRAQLNDADPRVQRAARRRLTLARLAEDWLAWDFGPLDGRNIEVFARMRPAIEALARGEDYQLAHPGSLPAMLDLPEGMSMPAITFWVSLPEGYAEGGPWPVIIHLHGFGGRRPWTPASPCPTSASRPPPTPGGTRPSWTCCWTTCWTSTTRIPIASPSPVSAWAASARMPGRRPGRSASARWPCWPAPGAIATCRGSRIYRYGSATALTTGPSPSKPAWRPLKRWKSSGPTCVTASSRNMGTASRRNSSTPKSSGPGSPATNAQSRRTRGTNRRARRERRERTRAEALRACRFL